MATIAEIRAKHPEYDDMTDQELANGLHKKFYADMPRDQFDTKLGVKPAVPSIGEQLSNPIGGIGQAVADLARTGSNFITLGARDRLAPFVTGRPYEQEQRLTREAHERAGTAGLGLDLALALEQPSAVAKYLKPAGNLFKRALGYGAEGAGYAGTQALIQGEDPLMPMALGAGFGAGGSAAGDVGGRVFGFGGKEHPLYKSDLEMRDIRESQPGTDYANELQARQDRVNAAKNAQGKGKEGFKNLAEGITMFDAPYGEDAIAKIAKMAAPPRLKTGAQTVGRALQGGGNPFARAALTYMFPPAVGMGAILEGVAPMLSEGRIKPKDVEALQGMIRNPNGGMKVDDATAGTVRDYLAKMMMGTGRDTFGGPR